MGSVPVGVQCPLTSSLDQFLGYWAGSGILGYRPRWCPPPSSVPRCFPFTLRLPLDFICVFPLRPMYLHSVDPSLTHFLGEFQACDWLWNPMLWSQRRNRGAHGAEISVQISALAGVEPQTLESSGRERYH